MALTLVMDVIYLTRCKYTPLVQCLVNQYYMFIKLNCEDFNEQTGRGYLINT